MIGVLPKRAYQFCVSPILLNLGNSPCNCPSHPCIIGIILNSIDENTRRKLVPTLNIKPTHKPIKNYYTELAEYAKVGAEHEGAVRTAFQNLLQHYCRQADFILVCEKTRHTPQKRRIRIDGEVVDAFDCHTDTGKQKIHTTTFRQKRGRNWRQVIRLKISSFSRRLGHSSTKTDTSDSM